MKRVAIIGLGLLGASFGMSLRGAGYRRIGWARRDSIRKKALNLDIVDEVTKSAGRKSVCGQDEEKEDEYEMCEVFADDGSIGAFFASVRNAARKAAFAECRISREPLRNRCQDAALRLERRSDSGRERREDGRMENCRFVLP